MRIPTTLLLAVLLVLGACTAGDPDPAVAELTAALEASQRQQDDLVERLEALEQLLEVSEEQGGTLADLEARLADATTELQQLSTALQHETEARDAGDAQLRSELDELVGRVDGLQATVVQLRTNVQELTDEVTSLEAQFRSHRSDEARHN